MNTKEQAESKLREFAETTERLRSSVGEVIVGQDEVISHVLTCLLSSSHVLLEGVPGLGKTLLIRTLAEVTGQPLSLIHI